MKRAEALATMPEAERLQRDRAVWSTWLGRYGLRLRREAEAGASVQDRICVMNATNPRWEGVGITVPARRPRRASIRKASWPHRQRGGKSSSHPLWRRAPGQGAEASGLNTAGQGWTQSSMLPPFHA